MYRIKNRDDVKKGVGEQMVTVRKVFSEFEMIGYLPVKLAKSSVLCFDRQRFASGQPFFL